MNEKNFRNGYGAQVWANGCKYVGYWKDDKAHGYGKFFYNQSEYYYGQWNKDRYHGYGMYVNLFNNNFS